MFKRLFSWSRMTRECPVRFYEGPLGKFRGSTHQKFLFLTVSCIVFVQQAALAMDPVSVGDKDQVADLLNSGMDVNQQNNLGFTPLYMAASFGREAVARLLLEHGAKVNLANHDGNTPLHMAARFGHEAVVRLLLEHNANVNQSNNDGLTPLRFAVLNGQKAVVRLLQAWPIMQQHANAARLAFYCTLHPRTGANSQSRVLNPYLIHEILQHVQPSDFPAIPAVVAPVVPAHATPVPTVPQQALAQSILSNPRVQIAATTITVLSFVAWRLLHH